MATRPLTLRLQPLVLTILFFFLGGGRGMDVPSPFFVSNNAGDEKAWRCGGEEIANRVVYTPSRSTLTIIPSFKSLHSLFFFFFDRC
jgi:hypothetical protein